MQLEDKLIDGRDAAHTESQQREDVTVQGEETLPTPVIEAMRDAGLERRRQLLGAVQMLLDRQTIQLSELQMPHLELRALEALQVAASGKSDLGKFVYASDRRDMLERALAVLQPNLTRADDQAARELHAQFTDLGSRVAELRHELTGLEDAQDELLEGAQKAALEAGATEPGDKPKPTPTDPDAPRPATTLIGPELAEPPRPPTTLVGPEVAGPVRAPTTLTGPELAEPARPPTTLVGPDLPPEPIPVTTLLGDDLAPDPPADSSLGDVTEIAASANRPWWRRPFG